MPTIAIGSSAGPRRRAAVGASAGRELSETRESRWAATAPGVGWSKTTVAGSRRPVAAPRRLRRSTPAIESKPMSLKARSGSTEVPPAWPRIAATVSRTRPRTASRRLSSGSAAIRRAQSDPAPPVPAPACTARRARVRTSPRRSAGSGSAPVRKRARSSATGTSSGSVPVSAVSNRVRPCFGVSGVIPARAQRARSASPRVPPIPCEASHSPQASEVAGSPEARRCAARASR